MNKGNSTTSTAPPLAFDFEAFDEAARAGADTITQAQGGFVDHDYAGLDRQLADNLVAVNLGRLFALFGWPDFAENPAEPLTRSELRRVEGKGGPLPYQSRPEYAQAFKPASDHEVRHWAEGLKSEHASQIGKRCDYDPDEMARALMNDIIPDAPREIEMLPFLDERPRDCFDPPRNVSFQTIIDAVKGAIRWVRQPQIGKAAGDIVVKETEWLWYPWIPLDGVTAIVGHGNAGKGHLLTQIAVHLINGLAWPGGQPCPKGDVIWYTSEDGVSKVKERLIAFGAKNLDERCVIADWYNGGDVIDFGSTRHFERIKDDVRRRRARLLVIDPFEAFVGSANPDKNVEIRRRVLGPLGELAAEMRCAPVFISHPTKDEERSAIHRIGGSVGIAAACRSAIAVGAADMSDPNTVRTMAHMKTSYSPPGVVTSHDFRLIPIPNPDKPGGFEPIARFQWGAESNTSPAEVLAFGGPAAESTPSSKLDEAMRYLRIALDGSPRPAQEVRAGAQNCGITEVTLKRAKQKLKIETEMKGGTGYWRLP